VIGIVAYFWIVKPLGGFSALSGSIALAIMMLADRYPVDGRDAKSCASSLKEAAYCPRHTLSPGHFSRLLSRWGSRHLSGVMLSIARITRGDWLRCYHGFRQPLFIIQRHEADAKSASADLQLRHQSL